MSEPCDVEDPMVIADYLAGRLGDERAEAFERHALACDACRERLEVAAAVRAVAGLEERALAGADAAIPSTPAGRRRQPWPRFARLAAAAALVIAAGSLLWLRDRGPAQTERTTETVRGLERRLALELRGDSERFELAWPRVPAAASYLVEVLDDAGEPVVSREVRALRTEISRAEIAARAGRTVRVTALDGVGQELLASAAVPLGGGSI
jgi:hypothetical protein